MGWNKHDGRIQATEGNVIEASRNSFFYGGGATLGSAPVAGGSGGPLRLSADLALAEAFFAPEIARRELESARWSARAAQNQAVRQAGLAYIDLQESAGEVADAETALADTQRMVQLTESFEQVGAGAAADVDRARAELGRRQQILWDADRRFRVRAAELARILRIDPATPLIPADQQLVPLDLVDAGEPVDALMETALRGRPEVHQLAHEIAARRAERDRAELDPWLPTLAATISAGSFGGGTGSDYLNAAGRSDLDLQAVWQLKGMGVGVAADRQRADSRVAQARTRLAGVQDRVQTETLQAYESVLAYRQQVAGAEEMLVAAQSSLRRNMARVQAGEGLPIELLQAIQAHADSLAIRTRAVANYNRAQIELLYAIGGLVP